MAELSPLSDEQLQAADKDLRASLAHLVESDAPAPVVDYARRFLHRVDAMGADELVHPLAYAWFREATLDALDGSFDTGLVRPGIEHLGLAWRDWQPLRRFETAVTPADSPDCPYDLEGLTMLLNEGTEGRLLLRVPDPQDLEQFIDVFSDAMTVLDQADPDAAQRWRRVVRMIIPVAVHPDSDIYLGGGSSLFLPGVLVLNTAMATDALALLATLVHEAAHVHLNLLCLVQPLALNDPDATFASPLRQDARPMEGVIHAAFVCGEVTRVFRTIAAAGTDHCDQAATIAAEHDAPLDDSLALIAQHAVLSDVGAQVLAHIEWSRSTP